MENINIMEIDASYNASNKHAHSSYHILFSFGQILVTFTRTIQADLIGTGTLLRLTNGKTMGKLITWIFWKKRNTATTKNAHIKSCVYFYGIHFTYTRIDR